MEYQQKWISVCVWVFQGRENEHELPPNNLIKTEMIFDNMLVIKAEQDTNKFTDLLCDEYDVIYQNQFMGIGPSYDDNQDNDSDEDELEEDGNETWLGWSNPRRRWARWFWYPEEDEKDVPANIILEDELEEQYLINAAFDNQVDNENNERRQKMVQIFTKIMKQDKAKSLEKAIIEHSKDAQKREMSLLPGIMSSFIKYTPISVALCILICPTKKTKIFPS